MALEKGEVGIIKWERLKGHNNKIQSISCLEPESNKPMTKKAFLRTLVEFWKWTEYIMIYGIIVYLVILCICIYIYIGVYIHIYNIYIVYLGNWKIYRWNEWCLRLVLKYFSKTNLWGIWELRLASVDKYWRWILSTSEIIVLFLLL